MPIRKHKTPCGCERESKKPGATVEGHGPRHGLTIRSEDLPKLGHVRSRRLVHFHRLQILGLLGSFDRGAPSLAHEYNIFDGLLERRAAVALLYVIQGYH